MDLYMELKAKFGKAFDWLVFFINRGKEGKRVLKKINFIIISESKKINFDMNLSESKVFIIFET